MVERMPAGALVMVLVVALVGLGTTAAFRYKVFSPIDEFGHFDYVSFVAREHRLPMLTTPLAPEVRAIAGGTYPAPADWGADGTSYEAFQPPAYYLLATPVFQLAGDWRTKVTLLRLFGLVLYLIALGLFIVLCHDVAKDHWREAMLFGSVFFLSPGNVVRAVTVGNEALDLPIGIAVSLALWRAVDRNSTRWLAVAAIATGVGVLTKFTFIAFLVPLLVVVVGRAWRERDNLGSAATTLGLALVPALMVLPWALLNHRHYGSFTANGQARLMQEPVVNPTGAPVPASRVVDRAAFALDSVASQDWWEVANQPVPTAVRWLILVSVYLLPVLFLMGGRTARALRGRLILAVPLVVSVAMIAFTSYFQQWEIMVFRYLRPAMPAWFLFAFLVWRADSPERDRTTVIALTALAGLVVVWLADAQHYLGIPL